MTNDTPSSKALHYGSSGQASVSASLPADSGAALCPPPSSLSMPHVNWRFHTVDGLRAFAMLMIFLYHMWQGAGEPRLDRFILGSPLNLFSLLPYLKAGVDLFMVLSGFCLFLPLCKPGSIEQWDTTNYFRRRLRRIVPPYYAAIAFTIILPHLLVMLMRMFGEQAKAQAWPTALDIITHLTFTHTFFGETFYSVQGPFWSLGLEMQFYAAFPLLVWGYKRFGTRIFGAVVAISLLYRFGLAIWLENQNPSISYVRTMSMTYFFLGCWMQFAMGMAAAHYVVSCRVRDFWLAPRNGWLLLLGAVSCFIIGESSWARLSFPLLPVRDTLVGLGCALSFVALCASKVWLRPLFENKVMRSLGFISYSVFLIHPSIGWFFSEFVRRQVGVSDAVVLFFVTATAGFIVTLAFSYLFFLAAEKPFLNRIPKRKRVVEGDVFAKVADTPVLIQDKAAP